MAARMTGAARTQLRGLANIWAAETSPAVEDEAPRLEEAEASAPPMEEDTPPSEDEEAEAP